MTTNHVFIPTTRQFWVFHLSGLSLLLLLYLSSIAQTSNRFYMELVLAGVWLPIFTLAVLLLRRIISPYMLNNERIENEIANIIFMSVVLAASMTAVIAAIVYPMFWSSLYSHEILELKQTTLLQSITKHISTNILLNFLLLTTWGFIYLGVKSKQISKGAIQKNVELESSLKEAKLQGLTNQLKPHFLFNCLNNIRFMIHENADQADNMITALSEILRYSLESKRDKVPMEEEINIVMRYLELVKLQHEDRLELDASIDKSLYRFMVPPMVIQLLVENAIKHGVENIRKKSTLILSVQSAGSDLIVLIKNPIPKTDASNVNSTKTGLANIRQRIALLYGDKANLYINKTELDFEARLRLPMENAV